MISDLKKDLSKVQANLNQKIKEKSDLNNQVIQRDSEVISAKIELEDVK